MMSTIPVNVPLGLILPAILLAGAAILVLIVEAFSSESVFGLPGRLGMGIVSIVGFLGAAFTAGIQWRRTLVDSANMLRLDHFSIFLTVVFCVGAILTTLISMNYLVEVGSGAGEYYALLLFATLGAFLMASAQHLIMVFLGLEVLSVAIYPLAGFLRRDRRSNEASIKYFLLGAFSSAFFLYGAALIYGAVGMQYSPSTYPLEAAQATGGLRALSFGVISNYVVVQSAHSPLFWGGVALLLVSFCFKSALSPFHMWTPDAYDGAPTPITAYMGSVVKAAAFAPFFRFFIEVLGRRADFNLASAYDRWAMPMVAVAILTMTWGNIAAVAEPSMKRMLAYSSIAHAGYIAIALVSESFDALLYYVAAYTLMVVGSFGCAALVRRKTGEEAHLIEEWRGVGLRFPWLAAAMSLFLFALAGFPPTAGFMGKFYIFRAALETGSRQGDNGYVFLVCIALLNSLVSVYYYLRVVVAMYRPAHEHADVLTLRKDRLAGLALAICAFGVLLLGIFPELLFGFFANSS